MIEEILIEVGAVSEETKCCGGGNEMETVGGPPVYQPHRDCW